MYTRKKIWGRSSYCGSIYTTTRWGGWTTFSLTCFLHTAWIDIYKGSIFAVVVIVCASSVSAWHSPMTVSVFLLLTLKGNLWCGKEGTRSIPKHQSLSTNETESQHFIHLNTQLQVISTSGKNFVTRWEIFFGLWSKCIFFRKQLNRLVPLSWRMRLTWLEPK